MEERKEYTYDKTALRSRLSDIRGTVSDKPRRSRAATENILPLLHGRVMIYISINTELDTKWLFEALTARNDVEIYAPYTVDGKITPQRLSEFGTADIYGNLPVSHYGERTDDIDIAVTPLLGFNEKGYRIGYGKGCYDSFFSHSRAYRIGIAFDRQKINFMPEKHDIPLDCCVTESGVIYFDHARHIG